jgi:eukaryotic-like serine/threonine-protein kinase
MSESVDFGADTSNLGSVMDISQLISQENIGRGGFGIVDRVLDPATGNQYALKTFAINQPAPLSREMEENVRRRFEREARTQSGIRHPNIVPVLETDLRSDPPRFVMPLADSSLARNLAADRTLGGRFMAVIMDIIAGLEELHSLRIYHRDLKPANVLRFLDRTAEGDEFAYYAIGDFGLMSLKETQVTVLTSVGMAIGSDMYTAPEITQDLREASAQSDIYSLGCILHDMIGTRPRIACQEIREDGEFAGILLNCTRIDPTRRFSSVSAVREALLALGDVTVQASSKQGSDIAALLDGTDPLSEDDWREIVNFLEDSRDELDRRAVWRKLQTQRIAEVTEQYPNSARRLGTMYAEWVRDGVFAFEDCDGIAVRLEQFINHSALDVQAECLMAMLYMGTSHNRFYVERKFQSMCGHAMAENLARRIAVEFRADGRDACKAIEHLEHSIRTNRRFLHPQLVETLNQICE